MISVVPAFIGMLALALLPKEGHLWTRWGMYLITIIGNVAGPCKCIFKYPSNTGWGLDNRAQSPKTPVTFVPGVFFSFGHFITDFRYSDLDSPPIQRRGTNEKVSHQHGSLHRLLCRKYSRSTSIPSERCSALYPRHHCLFDHVRARVCAHGVLESLLYVPDTLYGMAWMSK